jgi:hypothetical protein
MASLLDLAQARLQGLLDIPTRAARAIVNPTAFSGLLGAPTLPQQQGMAEAAYGLPARQNMSVLDPNQAAYLQGYQQGEPLAYLGAATPFAAPAVAAGAKAVAPKAGMALENYMASQGLLQNIVPVSTARDIKMPVTLPTDDVFRKAVENTPGATITDEGLVMNIMRKQKPQQAETESVRGGVFYLPEGSASMKYYGGSTSYGGTEKITGETLYKNPLFVKGATGGKAPEAAYEQIMGKEGLKQMRDDVNKIISQQIGGSGDVRVLVNGVPTESAVAKQVLRFGNDPQAFIDSMQAKLNAQKEAVKNASKEEILPGLSDYDLAKIDLENSQKMIEEAKSYVGKKITTQKSSIANVEDFLSKYAPDLQGYGSYIIDNSRQGNQLKYALQEAAIAQKARDAGYDSVIGYSKKRTGDPVISEVFDVREAIYPSTSGDYRLMDKFEGLLD